MIYGFETDSRDLLRRLNGGARGFSARHVKMDFDQLRPKLQLIRGAWFSAMKSPNLSSAGVFGHKVDQSDEFRRAEASGKLSNLMVEIPVESGTHTMMLTADGGITLYNQYIKEDEPLAIVSRTLTGYLKDCLHVVPFKEK
jgi:hypothetical protein